MARPRKSRGGLSTRGGLSASLLPFLLPFLFPFLLPFLLPFLFVLLNALGRECVGARARSAVTRERALAFVHEQVLEPRDKGPARSPDPFLNESKRSFPCNDGSCPCANALPTKGVKNHKEKGKEKGEEKGKEKGKE